MTRIRRASALVFTCEGESVIGQHYFHQTRAYLTRRTLGALARAGSFCDPELLFEGEPDRRGLAAELIALLALGFFHAEGSEAAALEDRLRSEWPWGTLAGFYHFGVKDPPYLPPQAVFELLQSKLEAGPPVPLTSAHTPTVALDPPILDDGGLLGLMARRRSYRGFDPELPLPLPALRDCLFSGLAITGWAESPVPGEGLMPLTTTPSGGARNPFEGIVVARNVEGLEPGVYHYSGAAGTLARFGGPPPPLGSLLGGQGWFDDAGALVILVASFERTSWKYHHPNALRVVWIEAGHIAQNLLLAATHHGLAAAPTCAISDRAVETLLGLDRLRHAAVHVIALGARGPRPSPADWATIHPNPAFLVR